MPCWSIAVSGALDPNLDELAELSLVIEIRKKGLDRRQGKCPTAHRVAKLREVPRTVTYSVFMGTGTGLLRRSRTR